MRHALALALLSAAAGLPLGAAAQGRPPSYEPQKRLRTALDTCMKTEVMQGAYCVQKCATGFRAATSGAKPACVATTAGAKHEPKKPTYTRKPEGSPTPPAYGAAGGG